MSAPTRPAHLILGDRHHGVARYAGEIAEMTGCAIWRDLGRAQAAKPRRMHLHFSDRLWGAEPAAAAQRIQALARRHSLTVTLHDLPQPSDGRDSHRRRTDCYRHVIAAARGVVCNSSWEAGLVAALPPRDAGTRTAVIPLPVDPAAAGRPRPMRREIGLIGFVYPGKGHEEAIDAAAALATAGGSPVAVVALGAVSAGHATTGEQLAALARRRGVRFSITGYLSEEAMLGRARQVLVPLAAHRHLSASGSIGSWLAAGRRPRVADALADPASTWLAPDAELKPGRAEVGAAYLDWWTREAGW